ncbi:MAG: prolyl oligopeptidase family serine peptidase [Rhizobiaceae bacterium]
MFVERTNYFAKPGMAEEVLAVRRRACDIRVELNLARGVIFTKCNASDDGADITWECRFASIADYQRDLEIRRSSAAFTSIRSEVGEVIERFERHFSMIDDGEESLKTLPAETSMSGQSIVPRQVTFQSGENKLAGYLYLPPGPGPFACIITNHGSGIEQGSDDLCRPGTASLLLSWGFASFLPHRAGYGASTGTPWRGDVSAEFGTPEYDDQLAARLDKESDDVIAALDWVNAQPEIDSGRVAVMGSSFGGTVTLFAAAKASQFRCAVEFAGAAMNWERTPKLRESMKQATCDLTQPIFFLQAETDYSTAPTKELGEVLKGGNPDSKSRIYPPFGISKNEGHLFEKTGSLIWGPDVRKFLTQFL